MFSKNKVADFIRFCKAFLTNQLACYAPKLYIKLTHETGRGRQEDNISEVVNYFNLCFSEYMEILEITSQNIEEKLVGKKVLEYGPGDLPGIALLFYAWGIDKVYCVDRFPLVSFSKFNNEVLIELCHSLQKKQQERALSCFREYGNPRSGLDEEKIKYIIHDNGLSCLEDEVEIVCSRAVLEHVNNLDLTLKDMEKALKTNGFGIHKVDLKSHGLHRENILDFLTWPTILWNLMYSHKGTPNRLRLSHYKESLLKTNLKIDFIRSVENCNVNVVHQVRPYLSKSFKFLSDEDLSTLSFWFKVTKQ